MSWVLCYAHVMKFWRILLWIVVSALALYLIAWVILGVTSVDDVYGREMFTYRADLMCVDCMSGARTGECPHHAPEVTYPTAYETTKVSQERDWSNISDSFILGKAYCESRHLTDAGSIRARPMPERSYIASFKNAGEQVSTAVAVMVWYVAVLLGGDSR
jgi:hypothetical protein